MEEVKKCTNCKNTLPITQFSPHNSLKSTKKRSTCKKCSSERVKEYIKEKSGDPEHRWKFLIKKDKQFNIDLGKKSKLKISKKKFLAWAKDNKQCFYCGTINIGTSHGVDRIDNKKGYAIDNIATCCPQCNQAKSNLTLVEFFNLIERIYNKHIKKEGDEA